MKCRSCDCFLSEYENSRKSLVTGDYIGLCAACYSSIASDCLSFGNPKLMELDEDFEAGGLVSLDDFFDEDTDEWDSR